MSGVVWRDWPGDPDRPALALHCMMGSAAYWGLIAARLDGRAALRGFDMPGHGKSDPWQPAPGVDFHTTVTRIAAAAIDRPLDLIGHSLGATVALRIAVGAPHAIRSLTLIEPVLFAAAPEAAHHAAGEGFAERFAAGDHEGAARIFLSIWGGPGGLDALPPAVRAAAVAQIPLIADTHGALHDDNARLLREGGLEGIDAPVLLIAGAESPPVVEAIADALAARLPDVGRAVVPGAGHMLPLTHPAEVAGLIAVNLDRA